MPEAERGAGTLDLSSGHLSLDFANTVDWHAGSRSLEFLTSYGELIAWSRHAGLLTDGEAEHLRRQAAGRPAEAANVLERAVALREAIYRIFSAVAAERPPKEDDLAILNAALSRALARAKVAATAEGFGWDWVRDEDALDQMLWPVARAAADLLTSEDRQRVRECEGDDCGWLFVDNSRNHSRRWCDMGSCGNRAKARRHYARRRAAQKGAVSCS